MLRPDMLDLPFLKVEGLGNDFLLVDRRDVDAPALEAELDAIARIASDLCDRRTGVGADGLLIVGPAASEGGAASMIVVNHDGSRPEMCGNGLRCVAHFVAHHSRHAEGTRPVIDTDDGPKACRVAPDPAAPSRARVTVQMGPARPLGAARHDAVGLRNFTGISMGNPHAITFVAANDDPERLAHEFGPRIEIDPAYPERTNVEFARREPNGSLTLWVWERGVGITGACGTGACATAAAAAWADLCPFDEPVDVRLPGGILRVTVPSDRRASLVMEGPSRFVFAGRVPA